MTAPPAPAAALKVAVFPVPGTGEVLQLAVLDQRASPPAPVQLALTAWAEEMASSELPETARKERRVGLGFMRLIGARWFGCGEAGCWMTIQGSVAGCVKSHDHEMGGGCWGLAVAATGDRRHHVIYGPVTLRRAKFLVPDGKVYFTSVAEGNVTVNPTSGSAFSTVQLPARAWRRFPPHSRGHSYPCSRRPWSMSH